MFSDTYLLVLLPGRAAAAVASAATTAAAAAAAPRRLFRRPVYESTVYVVFIDICISHASSRKTPT